MQHIYDSISFDKSSIYMIALVLISQQMNSMQRVKASPKLCNDQIRPNLFRVHKGKLRVKFKDFSSTS